MSKKFILALSLIIASRMSPQQPNAMKNYNENAKGQVITRGKIVYTETRINASAAKIWSVFEDFEKYPEWNPFVISLKGEPKKETTIQVTLKAGKKPMLFKPRVLQFEKEKEFRWIGKLILPRLFDGEHTFKIKDNGDGSCTFIQYEHFRGLLIPLLKNMLETDTRQGFEQMNAALKKRCEEK